MVNSIRSKLLREENDFIHQKVDTICIKEFNGSFRHLGRRIGPFKLGHPFRMDHYIARIFVEQGYLKFDEKGLLNSSAIKKINFQESTNPELRKIQDHVYVQALEQLNILGSLQNQPNSQREYGKLISDINDLIRVRLAKINRLATQNKDLRLKNMLTSEELVLYEELAEAIQNWREHLSTVQSKF